MQACRADHEADDNQDQAREAVADPAQIQAYDRDPANRTEADNPQDKTADLRCLVIAERDVAQAGPADSQRQR